MTATEILRTERLRLRPRVLDDLDACLSMDMDPEVGRYLYPHGRPTREARQSALGEQIAKNWPVVGGFWVVEWLDRPGFLGWCGLFPLQQSGMIEIGYRYMPTTWGQGVATEAGHCLLGHGFGALALDQVVAVTHPENRGSQAVLRKLGLRHAGLRWHYGLDLEFFSLSRRQYAAGATSR